MAECYSCGKDVESLSEQDFCGDCQKEFDTSQERAQWVEQRAEALEKAKEEGDLETLKRLASEIAVEAAVVVPEPPITVQPAASAEEA